MKEVSSVSLRGHIRLLRIHQWYKNFLVYLAIVFVEVPKEWPWPTMPAVFVWTNYIPLTLGFIVFCAVSSSNYIVNDIKDRAEDAAHPEKRGRPIPSGDVSVTSALLLSIVLLAGSLTTAYAMNPIFFILIILYIVNSQAYNFLLRRYAVVDVITIAVGFIIRAIAGAILLGVPFTSWLVVGVFFVALVLGFGKRKNELLYLGDDAVHHKHVYAQYDEKILDQCISLSAAWVVLFYALYTYENFRDTMNTQPVMMTVPIVAGIVLRYVYLLQSESPVGRKPHLAFRDKGILVGSIVFGLALVWTLFFWVPVFEFVRGLFPPLFIHL
ncbi:MAG: UbiA prenyltransferase family protein, partial [Candidatus Thorarchaeota archaeon]